MSARSPSLILRATLGFALVALLAVGGAGAFLYHSLERTVLERADYALLGRLAHFRSLLSADLSLETLGRSPQLFANMLGNEQDVFLIGTPGAKPVIASNPLQIALPELAVIPQTRRPTRADLREGQLADGTRWRAARVAVNTPEGPVELTAAHVLRNEDATLADFRLGLLGAVTLAFLATAGLGYLLLRRGLAPLRRIARHAGGITPTRLAAPLELADAPRELQPLVENYNAMLARLADGYGRLVQFSADLAHEIRTPINALMGHTEVALRQVRSSEDYQTLLASNLEELERISRLVESILFLARADDAQAVLTPQPLQLDEELARIADYFEGPRRRARPAPGGGRGWPGGRRSADAAPRPEQPGGQRHSLCRTGGRDPPAGGGWPDKRQQHRTRPGAGASATAVRPLLSRRSLASSAP